MLEVVKIDPQGARGWGSEFFFCQNFYLYYLGAHAKFQNPTTTPSGRISNEPEEERKKRKFPLMLMGGRAHGPACADGERGPPSA